MGSLIPSSLVAMPTADTRGALNALLQASQNRTAGLGGIVDVTKGITDRAAKEAELLRLAQADARAEEQLKLQQQAGQRQEKLFQQGLQDREALQRQDSLLSEGLGPIAGILNQAVTPDQANAMSISEPNMRSIDQAGFNVLKEMGYSGPEVDVSNIDEYMQLREVLTPEQLKAFGEARETQTGLLAEPQVTAQQSLSDIADSDKVNEGRAEQLTRVAAQLSREGLPVPPKLRESIESQLLADREAQQTALTGIDKNLDEAKKELRENRLNIYKNVDKVTKTLFDAAAKKVSSSGGGYSNKDVIDGSKAIIDLVGSLGRKHGVNAPKVTSVANSVISKYNSLIEEGIHPLAAQSLIKSKLTGRDYKDGFLLFNDAANIKFSFNNNDIANAQAMTVGAGYSSGTGQADASLLGLGERTILAEENENLLTNVAALEEKRRLAAMDPDERRLYTIRQALGSAAPEVAPTKPPTKPPTKAASNNRESTKKTNEDVLTEPKEETIAKTLYPDGSKDGYSYPGMTPEQAWEAEKISLEEGSNFYENEKDQRLLNSSDKEKVPNSPFKEDGRIHIESIEDLGTVLSEVAQKGGKTTRGLLDRVDNYVKEKTYNEDGSINTKGYFEVATEAMAPLVIANIGPAFVQNLVRKKAITNELGRELLDSIKRANHKDLAEALKKLKKQSILNYRELQRKATYGKL